MQHDQKKGGRDKEKVSIRRRSRSLLGRNTKNKKKKRQEKDEKDSQEGRPQRAKVGGSLKKKEREQRGCRMAFIQKEGVRVGVEKGPLFTTARSSPESLPKIQRKVTLLRVLNVKKVLHLGRKRGNIFCPSTKSLFMEQAGRTLCSPIIWTRR